ncbi:hypothetical protein Pelo_13118 [Pelomyxa schiedti]|nr:hypothetical protein Pelo_13118 [Pelomyxa schiedti]
MSTTIKALVFDVGGVLAPDLNTTVGGMINRFPVITEPELLLWLREAWILFDRSGSDELAQEQELAFWATFTKKFASRLPGTAPGDMVGALEPYVVFIDGMEQLLDLIQTRRPDLLLGICSNNASFTWLRTKNKLHLTKWFPQSHCVLSQEVGVKKPSPDIYQIARTCFPGISGPEILFIDDKKLNLDAAANTANFQVFQFPTFQNGAQALQSHLEALHVL